MSLNLVDFKATFDIIFKRAIWKMLRSFGMDPKITSQIEAIYDNIRMCSRHQWSTDRIVRETWLFVITYHVQFVHGVGHGRPEELMQGIQVTYQHQH